MVSLEVLVGELLTVDGLATSALEERSQLEAEEETKEDSKKTTYIATSEVTTLKHKLRDDTMELGALVSEPLLTGAEGTEVLSSLGNYIVVESEIDPTLVGCSKEETSALQLMMNRH